MASRAANLPEDRELVPRILLRAVGLLILTVLVMVSWARFTGQTPMAMPTEGRIIEERQLYLFGKMTGAVKVLDENGALIADLPPEKGGFIAGVSRSLMLKRRQANVDPDLPVRLVRFEDGHLGLRDDATGWRAELIGFGKDNTAAFARLLVKK